MGFKPTKDVHNLTYRQYPGLEITARGTTIGKLQQFMKLRMTVNEQNAEQIDKAFGFFAQRVVTWNIEHPEIELDEDFEISDDNEPVCATCGLEEGAPLPTTVKAMYCLELKFILSLIFGWMAAIASVSDPKELSFNSGEMNTHTQELMMKLAEMQNQ